MNGDVSSGNVAGIEVAGIGLSVSCRLPRGDWRESEMSVGRRTKLGERRAEVHGPLPVAFVSAARREIIEGSETRGKSSQGCSSALAALIRSPGTSASILRRRSCASELEM